MRRRDPNDAWVECSCGARHWGRAGAAGLALLDRASGTVALQLRSAASHQGGTWGLPGGAIGSGESALEGALREAQEEAAIPAAQVRPRFTRVLDHGEWSYTTVVADVVGDRPDLLPLDGESEDLRWVPVDDVGTYLLHPAFGEAWPALRTLTTTSAGMLIDVANVLGSRPDGWWRDRSGATTRLLASLDAGLETGLPGEWFGLDAALAWPEVTAVLEGDARTAVAPLPSGSGRPMDIVRAPRSGDDQLASLAQDSTVDALVVVTADRGLRERLPDRVRVIGPGTLRRLMDRPQGEGHK